MIKFFFGIEETIRRISRAFGARVFLTFMALSGPKKSLAGNRILD